MDFITWELVPTDFILLVIIPAVSGFIWKTNKDIAELKGKVDVLLKIIASKEGR